MHTDGRDQGREMWRVVFRELLAGILVLFCCIVVTKIKHSTLVADYSEGGYKDIDIRTKLTALKVAWVTKLLDDNFHPWKIIPTILFATFGGINNIFHHNFKASKQCRSKVNKLPKFYQELIQLWSKVGGKKCSNASEICGEVLWNNTWIVSNGETLYNKHFVDKGILTVKNIIDESGRPLSWAQAKQKYNLNNSHVFNWFGLIKSIARNGKISFAPTLTDLLLIFKTK